MSKIDFGLIFDISANMESIFYLFDDNDYQFNGFDILQIIEKICLRGESIKNEFLRIFSLLPGGQGNNIYDFCKIFEKAGKKFSKLGNDNNSNNGNVLSSLLGLLDTEEPEENLSEIIQKGINIFASNVIEGDDSEENEENDENDENEKEIDTAKILNGNEILRIVQNIINKIQSLNISSLSKLLDLDLNLNFIADYIFGNSSSEKAINLAINTFKKKSKDNFNFLLIISDGSLNISNKNDFIKKVKEEALDNHIIILTVYLAPNKIPKEKTLYDKVPRHLSDNPKNLFELSSTLNYDDPFSRFLVSQKWNLPTSGEFNLFLEVNNKQNLIQLIDLLNEAVFGLNNLFNKEISENPNSLIHQIANTVIDTMNQELIDEFKAIEQKGNTCYANAISVAMFMLSDKICGRKKLNYNKIRNQVIVKKKEYRKSSTFNILNLFLKEKKEEYKIECKICSEEEAKQAILKARPCIVRFALTQKQWNIFNNFFIENPQGILTKKIMETINDNNNEKTGHAAVLTHIEKGCLKILNSYGDQWGDNGYFRVENGEVLDMKFCEIFYDFSKLSDEEKGNFNNFMEGVEDYIKDMFFV